MQRKVEQILIYIIALTVTVGMCIRIDLYRQETTADIKALNEQNEDLQKQVGLMEADGDRYKQYINSLSEQLNIMQQQLDHKQDKADRGGERPHYELSTTERDLVERVVMAEAEDEPYEGKMLVCQCILNACRLNNKRPVEIIKQYAYAKRRPAPSGSVKRAVSAVFDKGETVTNEAIIYFYAPALVKSKFHESQRFVCEVGGHRFFAEE